MLLLLFLVLQLLFLVLQLLLMLYFVYYVLLQVSYVVSAIQAGAVGTQACNEAITTISSIVGDLETTAMFCTAGALNPEEGAQNVK